MYKVYQIQTGDTIDMIAELFHTTSDAIKRLNGIIGNVGLNPGGFLIVPVEEQKMFNTYVVKKGDSIYSIARKYGVDYDTLLELNGLDKEDYIYPEQEIVIPKEGVKTYRVKNGDTIQSVTSQLMVGYDTLSADNPNIFLERDQILFYQ